MKAKPFIYVGLILFMIADFGFAFYQYNNLPLDGDLPSIVAPSEHYSQILEEPFGFAALLNGEEYPASNRYFCHWAMVTYFKNVHGVVEPFFPDKVKFIYAFAAFFNCFVQALLLFLITVYVRRHFRFWQFDFVLAAAILLPFFQVDGYYEGIGVIDKSITYTFFYAFPWAFLMIFYLPFYLAVVRNKPIDVYFKVWMYPIWFALAVMLALSGSLVAPTILISVPIMHLAISIYKLQHASQKISIPNILQQFFKTTTSFLVVTVWLFLMAAYSFYIGQFNAENAANIPLAMRYKKFFVGVPKFLSYKPTFIWLTLLSVVNLFLLNRLNFFKRYPKLKWALVAIVVMCMVYLLLLPLGGYRPYRPLIVRYDTIVPVTLVTLFLLVFSSFELLRRLNGRTQQFYTVFLIGILAIFIFADWSYLNGSREDCQRKELYKIYASEERIVQLEDDCTILSWSIMPDHNYSGFIGEALRDWKIAKQDILFYQKDGE